MGVDMNVIEIEQLREALRMCVEALHEARTALVMEGYQSAGEAGYHALISQLDEALAQAREVLK